MARSADPNGPLYCRPVEVPLVPPVCVPGSGNEMMPCQRFFATTDGAATSHGCPQNPRPAPSCQNRQEKALQFNLKFCNLNNQCNLRLAFPRGASRFHATTAMNALTKIAVVSAFLASALSANAAIINLDLLGKAGAGLLAGNENAAVTGVPGSGGEFGQGIFFNDVTLQLTVNVAWGSGNGFLNLTSNANNSHIHGPTASGGTGSFTQDAVVLFNLPRVSDSAVNGSIATTVTLNSTQAAELLAGRYYVNVHTVNNGGGEIRGNIVIPEPSSIALIALGVLALTRRRR
jgi:hypothetical protein